MSELLSAVDDNQTQNMENPESHHQEKNSENEQKKIDQLSMQFEHAKVDLVFRIQKSKTSALL